MPSFGPEYAVLYREINTFLGAEIILPMGIHGDIDEIIRSAFDRLADLADSFYAFPVAERAGDEIVLHVDHNEDLGIHVIRSQMAETIILVNARTNGF